MKFYSGRKSGFYFLKYTSKFFLLEFHLKTASYYVFFFFDFWPKIFSKNFMKKCSQRILLPVYTLKFSVDHQKFKFIKKKRIVNL